jgi:hypothetical protein
MKPQNYTYLTRIASRNLLSRHYASVSTIFKQNQPQHQPQNQPQFQLNTQHSKRSFSTNNKHSQSTPLNSTQHTQRNDPVMDRNNHQNERKIQFLTKMSNSIKLSKISKISNPLFTGSIMGLSGSVLAASNGLTLWEETEAEKESSQRRGAFRDSFQSNSSNLDALQSLDPSILQTLDLNDPHFVQNFNKVNKQAPQQLTPPNSFMGGHLSGNSLDQDLENVKNDPNFADFFPDQDEHQLNDSEDHYLNLLNDAKKRESDAKFPQRVEREWEEEMAISQFNNILQSSQKVTDKNEQAHQLAIYERLMRGMTFEEAKEDIAILLDKERRRLDPNYRSQGDLNKAIEKKAIEFVEAHDKPLLPSELRTLFPQQYDLWLRDVNQEGQLVGFGGTPRLETEEHSPEEMQYDKDLLNEITHWFKLHMPDKNTSEELRDELLKTPIPEKFKDKHELLLYFHRHDWDQEQNRQKKQQVEQIKHTIETILESGIFEAYKMNLFTRYNPWSYYFVPQSPFSALQPLIPTEEEFSKLSQKDPLSLTPRDFDTLEAGQFYFDKWLGILRERPELLDMVEEIQLENKISKNVQEQIEAMTELFEDQIEDNEGQNDLGINPDVFNVFVSGLKTMIIPNKDIAEFSKIKSFDSYRKLRAEFQRSVLEYNSIALVIDELRRDRDPSLKDLKRAHALAKTKMKVLHDKFENYMRFEAMRNAIPKDELKEAIDGEFETILRVANDRLKLQVKAQRTGDYSILDTIDDFSSPSAFGEKTVIRMMLEDQLAEINTRTRSIEKEVEEIKDHHEKMMAKIKHRHGSNPIVLNISPELLAAMDFNSSTDESTNDTKTINKNSLIIGKNGAKIQSDADQNITLPEISLDEIRSTKRPGNIAGVDVAALPGTQITLQRVYNPNTNKYVYFCESEKEREIYNKWSKTLSEQHARMLELRQLSRAREHTKYKAQIRAEIEEFKKAQQIEKDKQIAEIRERLTQKGYTSGQIEEIIAKYDFSAPVPANMKEIYQRYTEHDEFSQRVQDSLDPRILASYALELQELEKIFTPLGKRMFQRYIMIKQKGPQKLTKAEENFVENLVSHFSKSPIEPEILEHFPQISQSSYLVPFMDQHTIQTPKPPPYTFQWPPLMEEFLTSLTFDQKFSRLNLQWSPYTYFSGFNSHLGREEFEAFARTGPAHHLDPKPAPLLPFGAPLSTYFSPQTAMTVFGVLHFGPFTQGDDIEYLEDLDNNINYQDNEISDYGFKFDDDKNINFEKFSYKDAMELQNLNKSKGRKSFAQRIKEPKSIYEELESIEWDDINQRVKLLRHIREKRHELETSIDLTKDISFSSDPFEDDDFFITIQNQHSNGNRPTQVERIMKSIDKNKKPVQNMLTDKLGMGNGGGNGNGNENGNGNGQDVIPKEVEGQDIPQNHDYNNHLENNIQNQSENRSENKKISLDDIIQEFHDGKLQAELDAAQNESKNAKKSQQKKENEDYIEVGMDVFQALDDGAITTALNQFARLTVTADNNVAQLQNSQFSMLTYNKIQSKRIPFFCVTNLEYLSDEQLTSSSNQIFESFPSPTKNLTDQPSMFGSIDSVLDTMWKGFQEGIDKRQIEDGLLNPDEVYNPPQKPVNDPKGAVVSAWLFAGSLDTPVAKLVNYYKLDEFIHQIEETQLKVHSLTAPNLVQAYFMQREEETQCNYVGPFVKQMFGNGKGNDDKDKEFEIEMQNQMRKNFEQNRLEAKIDFYTEQKKKHWPSRLQDDLRSDNPLMLGQPLPALIAYVQETGLDQPLHVPIEQNDDTSSAKNVTISSSSPNTPPEGYQLNPIFSSDPVKLEEKQQYENFLQNARVKSFFENESNYQANYRKYNPNGYHWPDLLSISPLPLPELITKLTNGVSMVDLGLEYLLNDKGEYVGDETGQKQLQQLKNHQMSTPSKKVPYNSAAHLINPDALWVHRLQCYYAHERKIDDNLPFVPVHERRATAYRYGHLSPQNRAEMLLDDAQMLYHAVLLVTPDHLLENNNSQGPGDDFNFLKRNGGKNSAMNNKPKEKSQDLIRKEYLISIYSTPDPLLGVDMSDLFQPEELYRLRNPDKFPSKNNIKSDQNGNENGNDDDDDDDDGNNSSAHNLPINIDSTNTSNAGSWLGGIFGWFTGS